MQHVDGAGHTLPVRYGDKRRKQPRLDSRGDEIHAATSNHRA
jgi:hypothetical protein